MFAEEEALPLPDASVTAADETLTFKVPSEVGVIVAE